MDVSGLATILSTAVAVIGLALTALARRDAARSAQGARNAVVAAERTAKTMEEQTRLLRDQHKREADAARPSVSVKMTHVWRVPRGRVAPDVGIRITVENQSGVVDTLRHVRVDYRDRPYASPGGELSKADGAEMPVELKPHLPVEFRFDFSTAPHDPPNDEHLPTQLTVEFGRAGPMSLTFPVFPAPGDQLPTAATVVEALEGR